MLEITNADIDKAYRCMKDPLSECPAANALQRLFPNEVITVGLNVFKVGSLYFRCETSGDWIANAVNWEVKRENIKPITFRLEQVWATTP